MSMHFDLPDILRAERAGRAMALAVSGPVRARVSTSLAGAAALAAARHIHNRGLAVQIEMVDADAQACTAFATMLEVVGCMDLPMRQADLHAPLDAECLWLDGTEDAAFRNSGAAPPLAAAAYIADDPRRIAHDQGMGGHILRHHGPCARSRNLDHRRRGLIEDP